MTETQLKEEALNLLGEEVVNVELRSEHWDSILSRTYRWFAARKGIVRKFSISIIPSQSDYDLPSDFKGVVGYIPFGSTSETSSTSDDISIAFSYETWMYQNPNTHGLLDMALLRNHTALIKDEMGATEGYHIESRVDYLDTGDATSVNIIHVSPMPAAYSTAWVFYTSSTFGSSELSGLKPIDEEILIEVALAHAKLTLGRMRGKFSDLQVPGGTVTLDGDRLIDEAKESLRDLEARIYSSQEPMLFITR